MYLAGSFYQQINNNLVSLADRVTADEAAMASMDTWAGGIDSAMEDLETRLTTMEGFDLSGLEGRVTAAETAIAGKAPTNHSHAWGDITGKPSTFAPSTHTHAWADITGKPTIPTLSAQAHIADAATNAPSNAAVNAPTNSKTDYNILTTLLGTLTDGLNQTNTAQNSIATIVNANAVKQNAMGTIVVAIAQKLNLTFDALELNGILQA